ncbi:gp541 [Bacillus phage G]|uniref:Gp541 n=1 Tax=Bacillus phage G TaxID=2884420 RepID=G3MAT1_9CAUD|nr:gp541 [Bacillus phage G]AEO93798.1 gp541 [Bacillus phage G]
MNFVVGQIVDTSEVLDLINRIHYNQQEINESDDLETRLYVHQKYEVVELLVSELEDSPYYLDDDLVDEYLKMSPETMQPIVFNIFEGRRLLVDGGHRIEVAKLLKLEKIKGFVGYDEPDWSEYNEKYEDS